MLTASKRRYFLQLLVYLKHPVQTVSARVTPLQAHPGNTLPAVRLAFQCRAQTIRSDAELNRAAGCSLRPADQEYGVTDVAVPVTDRHRLVRTWRSVRWGAKSEPGDGDRLPEQPRLLRRTLDLLVEENILPLNSIPRQIGL